MRHLLTLNILSQYEMFVLSIHYDVIIHQTLLICANNLCVGVLGEGKFASIALR